MAEPHFHPSADSSNALVMAGLAPTPHALRRQGSAAISVPFAAMKRAPELRPILALLLALLLLAAACDSDDGVAIGDEPSSNTLDDTEDDEPELDEDDDQDDFDDANDDGDDATDEPPATSLTGGGIDESLDRGDIDCSEEGLGADDTTFFYVAHVVVDGNLGALCFGDHDDTLISSWQALASITPPGQLRDLGLFGGFGAGDETGGTTLAFVNTLDDAGSLFQMSVNLDEADNNQDELLLTMAHEFSHVFTATSPQIDRDADPDDCETYYNGEGCYLQDSIMAEWIELFWGNGLIDEIDPNNEATVDAGEQRCALNPGFFGAYAASNPEEDFAESFSAYVFDVPAATDEQEQKLAWIDDQAGLTEFRDRAIAAELGPLANNFDPCG